MAVTPTQGKFGSAKALFLVGGYNMLAAKVQSARYKIEALMTPSHGLGDAWEETSPVGLMKAELAQEGGFWDTTGASSHEALKDSVGVARVACLAFGGNAIGQPFIGFAGPYEQAFEVLSKRGDLTRANAEYAVSGQAEQGTILHALTAETTDPATTEPASAVDWASEPSNRVVPITSSSVANPTTITTPVAHGLTTGDIIVISGHSGSSPTINGERVVTVVTPTTFTIPVNVTVGGTGGTFVVVKTQRGGAGYLQITNLTLGGFTNAAVTIRHSADGVTFVDLVTFTVVTAVRAAQRVEVAGAVNRFLSSTIDFTGAGAGETCTFMTGFSRF